jgi:hypothetical protein
VTARKREIEDQRRTVNGRLCPPSLTEQTILRLQPKEPKQETSSHPKETTQCIQRKNEAIMTGKEPTSVVSKILVQNKQRQETSSCSPILFLFFELLERGNEHPFSLIGRCIYEHLMSFSIEYVYSRSKKEGSCVISDHKSRHKQE